MGKLVLELDDVNHAFDYVRRNAQSFSEYLADFIDILKSFVDLAVGFVVRVQRIESADELKSFLDAFSKSGLFWTDKNKKIIPFWSVFLSSSGSETKIMCLLVDVFSKEREHDVVKKFGIEVGRVADEFEKRFFDEVGGQVSNTNAKIQLVKKLIKKLDDISYIRLGDIFKKLDTPIDMVSVKNSADVLGEITSETGRQKLVNLNEDKNEYFFRLFNSLKYSIFDYSLVLSYLLKKYTKFFGYSVEQLKGVLASEYFLYITLANTGYSLILSASYDVKKNNNRKYWFVFEPYGDFKNIRKLVSLLSNHTLNPKSLTSTVNVLYWVVPGNVDVLKSGRVSVSLNVYDRNNLADLDRFMKHWINFNFQVMSSFFSLLIYGDVEAVRRFYVFVSFFELSVVLAFLCEFWLSTKMRLFGFEELVNFVVADERSSYYLNDDFHGSDLGGDLELLKRFFRGDGAVKNLFVRSLVRSALFFKKLLKNQRNTEKHAFSVSKQNKNYFSYSYVGSISLILSSVREFMERVFEFLNDPVLASSGVRGFDNKVLSDFAINQENLDKNAFGLLTSAEFSETKVDVLKFSVILTTDVVLGSFLNFLNFSIPYTESGVNFALLRSELREAFVSTLNTLWRALGKIGKTKGSFL